MNKVVVLLRPRLWSFRNRGFTKKDNVRYLFFSGIGLFFWAGIFVLSHRVLVYFQSAEDVGDILAYKLLSMLLLMFFSLLIFSSILTSLSKLYLSRDLELVHSLPVSREKIFFARWLESILDSSWMVIIYTTPILLAYGRVYAPGLLFYFDMVLAVLPLCIIASALSTLLVLLVVAILPASRIRSIIVFLGLATFAVLFVAFRLLRPERLANPEEFASALLYLQNLSTPSSPLLPSTWAFDSLKAALLNDSKNALFHAALLWSGAIFLAFVGIWMARAVYFKGFSKAQAALARTSQFKGQCLDRIFFFLSGPARAFVTKEIKTFWRDQTQWSQIFLIGALVAIYLYNFSVLPLDRAPVRTIYLQNVLSFLNMALAAFVLTAVAARLVFPSVSIEGNSFWIVRSGPISMRTFLWIKLFIYLLPLLILSEILVIAANLLLNVTPFMMYLSVTTLLLTTPGVVALGVGLGAAYPDFNSENPTQAATSFGGLLFMTLSAVYIGAVTVLEAGPVYTVFMAGVKGRELSGYEWAWAAGSFFLVLALSVLALFLPMRLGERRLVAGRTSINK